MSQWWQCLYSSVKERMKINTAVRHLLELKKLQNKRLNLDIVVFGEKINMGYSEAKPSLGTEPVLQGLFTMIYLSGVYF